MILDQLEVTTEQFAAGTGWSVKAEGACREDRCVALPADALRDGRVSVAEAAGPLGMALLHDEEQKLWALGPSSVTGRALMSARVAPLILPDLDGRPFALESLRGQKVLLVAWASW